MSTQTDKIYAAAQAHIDDFTFDQSVVEVFPDMIQRSVPGYSTIISTIGQLAKRFHQPNTNIYDLGCSLGAATSSIRHSLNTNQGKIIAVDNSAAMVERCKSHVNAFKSRLPVEVRLGDILTTEIDNASLVVLNFTLQFIAPPLRQALLSKICLGIVPGGALILSEKIKANDPATDEVLVDLHHIYKRVNGYSELEISQKRTALENVMKPNTLDENHHCLRQAGFRHSQNWYQCFNFCSMIAIK